MHQFATVQSEVIFDATTKPPLQVLAVVEGNSEKNKVWDGTHDGAINYIKFYLYSITHSVFIISY